MGATLTEPRPVRLTARRVLLGLGLSAAVIRYGGTGGTETSPDPLTTTDGRYHACHVPSEHGVTEHLAAYLARCGDPTYASDTPATTQGATQP